MSKNQTLLTLFKQLHALTLEQSKWIGQGDYDKLQELVDKKQDLMESIDGLGDVPIEDVAQIKDLLLQIQSLDRVNEKEVLAKYIDTCVQLTELNKGSEHPKPQARFLDKRA